MKRSIVVQCLWILGLLLSFPTNGDTIPLGNNSRVVGKGQQYQVVTPEDSEHMAGRRTTDVSGVMYLEDAQSELIDLGVRIPALKRRFNQLKGAVPGSPRYELMREAQRDLEGTQTRIRVLNGMIRTLKPRPKELEREGAAIPPQAPSAPVLSEHPVPSEDAVGAAAETTVKPEESFSQGRMPEANAVASREQGRDPLPWIVAILALVLAISCVVAFVVYLRRQKPVSS